MTSCGSFEAVLAAGELKHTALPVLDALASGKWISAIDYHYDGAGNVDSITAGGMTVNSTFRAPGRPTERRFTLPGGKTLRRTYSYDDATGSVGRMNGMHASIDGALFGGSDITFDGDTVLRKQINLAGLSGGARSNTYGYDDRGRLTGALLNTTAAGNAAQAGPAGGTTVDLTVADFRTSLERGGSAASTVTTESTAGHKVAALAKGGVAQPRLYQNADGSEGGVLSDDGRYVYTFDEKGRLTHVTQKLLGATSNLLRVRYYYNGVGRLAGRHVESAPVLNNTQPAETDWTLATAAQVAGQPLPAAATFVWDPVTDQLLAIYAEGSGGNPGTLLRQFVHGGLGLDDPVEVIAADPSGQNVTRMYPVYDEAGAGSLQAIVGEDGSLLARDLQKDPYGEETVAIAAPVVDKVSITATKETDGTLRQVSVTLRSTEPLDATTAANGGRLASVTATGTVVHTSTAQPALSSDGFTLTWTLAAADWTALTTQGSATQAPIALSVAATSTLRSTTYGISTPVLPATPEMLAKGNVYSTSPLPLEIREPLTLVSSSLTSAGSETPYELTDLAAAGIPLAALTGDPTNGMLISPFQAQPFADPFTGKTYVRARWYDPGTGTWLSADPVGYTDSSNLYAFAGGDPVNGRDPAGLEASVGKSGWFILINPKTGKRQRISPQWAHANPQQLQNELMTVAGLSYDAAVALMRNGGVNWASISAAPGPVGMSAPTNRAGETALMPGLAVNNNLIKPVSDVIADVYGQDRIPSAYPGSSEQWDVYDRTNDVSEAVTVPMVAAGVANGLSAWVESGRIAIAYRVEGSPNMRIVINPDGRVAIIGNDQRMLWVNFGSRARAEVFFELKLEQSMPGLQMKSFELPQRVVDELRAIAVEQADSWEYPGAPQIGDSMRAPDQLGLRPSQIEKLRGAIIQGSGQVHK